MPTVSLPEFHCHRCVYSWTPRRIPVRMCPRCKSRLWDVPEVRPVHLGNGLGIPEVLGPHRDRILTLVRAYGAKRVQVFGSVRRRTARERSDVDLLVDALPGASLLDHARLETELRRILRRAVDVVEEGDLPWSMRPQVLAEAVPL
ncbi:MAG TPA: nucleotidyltransferase family protein [Thermoplasmata archaeon]|nr:nucleotidyltransferase family protein [Thermoplasmata archaeon]